jgi:hypothetical protein
MQAPSGCVRKLEYYWKNAGEVQEREKADNTSVFRAVGHHGLGRRHKKGVYLARARGGMRNTAMLRSGKRAIRSSSTLVDYIIHPKLRGQNMPP